MIIRNSLQQVGVIGGVIGRLIVLPLLVLTCPGPAQAITNTGVHFTVGLCLDADVWKRRADPSVLSETDLCPIVAHVCAGDALSRYTCRATRLAADFLRSLGFSGVAAVSRYTPPTGLPLNGQECRTSSCL